MERQNEEPNPKFSNSIRKQVTLEDFSKQLYEIVTDNLNGLIYMAQNYHIKIKLVTGECFEIKITK